MRALSAFRKAQGCCNNMMSVPMRLFPVLSLSGLVILASILARPLMPVDETRYLAVAWEMWLTGDFLVPHLNGLPYSHKPPLLFWLIHAGWWLFGVNDLWPRLVAPLFALGNLWLTARIARQLWPDRPQVGILASLILVTSFYWLMFSTMVMFDMPVVFFVLLGIYGLLRVEARQRFGWTFLFLGVALGALVKGPFAVIFLALVTVTAPLWMRVGEDWLRWYLRAGAAGIGGGLVALAWAIPAAMHGGEQYAAEILWGQMAGRAVNAFDHARPVWWYLPVLFVMLLPLPLWSGFWQALREVAAKTFNRRWLFVVWIVPPFILLSVASGKQPHYLLPILPALALLLARALDDLPVWMGRAIGPGLAWMMLGLVLLVAPWVSDLGGWAPLLRQGTFLAGVVPLAIGLWLMLIQRDAVKTLQAMAFSSAVVALALLVYVAPLRSNYDLSPFSKTLSQLEQDHPFAVLGEYRGEYQFMGRLEHHVMELGNTLEVRSWCASVPQGVVLITHNNPPRGGYLASTPYRSKTVAAWPCAAIEEGLSQL